MNKDFNGFDEMVEALEENEDMVECKECFDLVPKTDCEKSEVGYICPVCKGLRTAPAQARFVDPYDSYTQEFPEVQDYDPGSVVEYEKEPGLGDALADLIADEYEAIDGYEVADETIQHADIDEDEKDEILDTLDHIKEEEEEHIDELKELCPECDPKAEPEKLEEAAEEEEVEDIPEEETEDSEENENEEVSDLDSAYEAALEIANESGVGQVFGYARKDTEEFVAVEPFEVDDPEAVEDDLMAVYDDVAYAYVAYPEKELSEALYENVQLHEGPGRFLKGLGQKIGNAAKHIANKDSGKLIDKFFNNGYILIFEGPKDGMPEEHKEEHDTADQALTAALHYSKEYPKYKVWVFAKPIDESELTPREKNLAKAKNGLSAMIGCFRNGTALQKKDKEIADTLKKIEIDKQDLMKTTGKAAGEKKGDPRDSMGEDEDEGNEDDGNGDGDDKPKDPEDTPVDEDDEDLEAEEEETVETLRAEALKILGEKKDAAGYTEDSYAAYSNKYDNYLRVIKNAKKKETFKDKYLPTLPGLVAKINALLKPVEDEDEDLESDDEDTVSNDTGNLEEAKKKAKEALGAKKEAVEGDTKYTEDSYKEYSEGYDKMVAAIDKVTTEEDLKKIVDQIPKLNGILEIDDTQAEEEHIEIEVDETSEEEETPADTADVKLSEVSEEQLKKLFTAVTGQGVGDNKKWQKVMKRMRAKLQELGESLDPQDYRPEDFIHEDFQTEKEAVQSLKDTADSLKATAGSIKNMTSAMREEYHRYANPAELAAMEDIEELVTNALTKVYDEITAWGYEAAEIDSQSFMCQEDEACLQYMLEFNDLDPDEVEDLASQLEMLLENEISVYKPVPEIRGISVSVALPDYDLADEDDEAEGITKASFLFYVDFARHLF